MTLSRLIAAWCLFWARYHLRYHDELMERVDRLRERAWGC